MNFHLSIGRLVRNHERCQQEGWHKLNDAADVVRVSPMTRRLAIERGEIAGEHPLPDGPWIINRSDLEIETAERLRQRARSRSRIPTKPDATRPFCTR